MFSYASLPEEIHLSKLSIWLSSQKGAESSLVKVEEASEDIRLEVEETLQSAIQALGITPSSRVSSTLEPVSFKPKNLFTYFDYLECLRMIAECCGTKGEKNMFGAYTEPCLVAVNAALTKWENKYLHLVSSSESLTKLVHLTYPSLKRRIEKINSQSDELTRQISEHDHLTQTYDKKCRDLCRQWGVSIDHSLDSIDAVDQPTTTSTRLQCISGSDQCKKVANSLQQQLDSYASPAYRKSIFESKILAEINTPDFLECFLCYHSFLCFMDTKLKRQASQSPSSCFCSSLSMGGALPLLQLALRKGQSLTDEHTGQLFQGKTPQKSTSSTSLDSNTSGDEWTHVSAYDITGSDNDVEIINSSNPDSTQMQDIITELSQDKQEELLQEVVALKGFFLSQVGQLQGDEDSQKQSGVIDMASLLRSSEEGQEGSGGWAAGRGDVLRSGGAVTQRVLNSFGSDDVLNMLALESNPSYTARIHQEMMLSYRKFVMFGSMAKRETQERTNLKATVTKMKKDLAVMKDNVFELKASLELSLKDLAASSLGKTNSSVTIVGDFELIV